MSEHYAVIGTGYWGQNHVRVAKELVEAGELDSVLLCDVDEERVAGLADSYSVEYVTDHTEIPSHDIDAATIATPSPTHHEVATDLLREGVDVLVEKPLALDSDAAWDIVQCADEHGQALGVGHIFRYHPALNELKHRIDRGELGEIRHLQTNRFSFRVPRQTAGALYSLAVHDLDIYNYLLEASPQSLYCQLDSHIREGIDETATITLDYDGVTGTINESWQIPVFGKQRDLVVVGSERSAYLNYLDDTEVELFDSRIVNREGHLHAQQEGSTRFETENGEPLKIEVQSFLEAGRTGNGPRADGRVGAETVELLEAAQRSDERGQAIEL